MPTKNSNPIHLGARLCAWFVSSCAAAVVPTWVLAQDLVQGNAPYYLGASQAITHDSNLYRLSDSTPAPVGGLSKSDTTYTSMALAGFEQIAGRQRWRADGSLSAVRFGNNSALNHQAYNLKLGADWASIERLSGSVNAHVDKALVRFNNDSLVANAFGRNMVTTRGFDGTVRMGVVTRWTLEAGVAYQRADYSALSYAARDFRQSSVALGLRYVPSSALSFALTARQTTGQFPHVLAPTSASTVADHYSGSNLDLSTRWVASAASQIDARVSWGHTRFDRATGNDFSGVTGVGTWTWRPTGKLRFEARVARERGQDVTALELFAIGRAVDVSRTSTTWLLGATHELSSKINVTASVGGSNRDLVDTRATTGGPTNTTNTAISVHGSDRSELRALGLRWTPTRSVLLGCDVSSERRSTQSSLSSAYSSQALGCFGRFTLQ